MGKLSRGPLIALLAAISLLSAFAAADLDRPPLPTPVSINHDAGRGDWKEWERFHPKAPVFLTLHLTNSSDLLFMVDTGAPSTILDKSLIPKLGARLDTKKIRYGWKANGAPLVGIYAAPKILLGDVPLETDSRVFIDDLARIWPGPPMAGILGMDCLQHYCLQFDFKAGQLRFLDPDQPAATNLGNGLPLDNGRDGATTRLDFFDRKNVIFHLDTAAYDDGALTGSLFRHALKSQHIYWTTEWKLPDGSVGRHEYLWDAQINHADYMQLVFADCSVGATESMNFIGLHFLARHLVTLNFPKHRLYLKQQSFEPLGSGSGITFEAEEFLRALKNQGRLPGCAADEHGQLTIAGSAPDTTGAPVSRTFALTKNGYALTYYYTVTETSPGSWRLEKVWLTDTQGRKVKEYPVP